MAIVVDVYVVVRHHQRILEVSSEMTDSNCKPCERFDLLRWDLGRKLRNKKGIALISSSLVQVGIDVGKSTP